MTEREVSINPEAIEGREFRVPAIVGLGSGRGFKLGGLHLPIGWEKSIPRLKKEIDPKGFQTYLDKDCERKGFKSGVVKFDNATGVLTEVSIQTDPPVKLNLSASSPERENGLYTGSEVGNLNAAIILQKIAVGFLDKIDPEVSYPYIDGEGLSYGSFGLSIPKEFLETKEQLRNDYEQNRFEIGASNIAGTFGMDLDRIDFDKRGIPTMIKLQQGNACYYNFNETLGRYCGHNVDSAWQAVVLHGVAASFINGLLQKKGQGWY